MVVNAIEIHHLNKSYGRTQVLNNLSAIFPAGKVTGLIGPNGAGKSTLFKSLVGLTKPQSGSIKIFGQPPAWRLNQQIAYLPDRGQWYGFHSVGHALKFAQSVFPLFNLQRAEELATSMGLDFNQQVGVLSKGQAARLQLILCLARDTQLILLDEPFSGIDLVSREKIIDGIISTLIDTQQTLVISTHELHQVESLLDYVVFINQGQVVLAEDVENLRAQHESVESVYRRLFA